MLTTEIQKVGKKSDSVGCERHFLIVFGNMMNRIVRSVLKTKKRMMSKMNITSPITSSPENLCGVCESSRAIPPVDIVQVNQASVKW
jgi:hypothetical protein